MQILFACSISAMYVCMHEVCINFYIFFSETVMNVCIHWQVGGVLNHLNNDPLNSLSCALVITLFWVIASFLLLNHPKI